MKLFLFNARRYLKIWAIHWKNSLMERMAYKYNFILMILGVVIQMLLALIFIKVIFSYISNLAGWSFNEALIVTATYMIIDGLAWATFSYISGINKHIRAGTFDNILIKPVDSQFLLSVARVDPEDWSRVITAIIVFIYAFQKLGLTAFELIKNLFFYIIFIICAYFIVYSITLLIKSITIRVIEDSSLWSLTMNIIKTSQYPTDIFFHKAARILFSTLIPLAFIATVPAKILIWGPRFDLIFYSFILAAIFLYISRKFYLNALKHYASASS
jgi:ABC-2 type transport system permease protein